MWTRQCTCRGVITSGQWEIFHVLTCDLTPQSWYQSNVVCLVTSVWGEEGGPEQRVEIIPGSVPQCRVTKEN